MSQLLRLGQCARPVALAAIVLAGLLPGRALATDIYPSFYGTIVNISPDRQFITVSPSKDQFLVIDVRDLGSLPYDQGIFKLDNVILIKTKRIGNTLVATGFEQARNGEEESTKDGIEQKEKPKEEKDEPRQTPP
jgi:hypothetical protein